MRAASRTPPEVPVREAPLASRARSGPEAIEIGRVAAKVEEGERITPAEALLLHEHADLLTLGRLADLVRHRKHPEPIVTYIVDRNIMDACQDGLGWVLLRGRRDG